MRLKRTKQWYERHPKILAFLCCFAAIEAELLYDLLASLKASPKFKQTVKIKNPLKWPKLYKNHRRLTSTCIDTFIDTFLAIENKSKSKEFEVDLLQHLKEEWMSPKPFSAKRPPKFLRKPILNILKPKNPFLFNYLEKLVEEEKINERERLAEWEKFNSVHEVAFVLTVLIPCWFEYREFAIPLFRRARHGNMEALEKILWLDKNAIHDLRIAKELYLASQKPDGARYRRIMRAQETYPKTKLSPMKVKIWMAGLIRLLSEGFQHKLSTTEIRKLFDALAYDLHGTYYDADITLEEDAFRKAVTREKEFWKPFVKGVFESVLK